MTRPGSPLRDRMVFCVGARRSGTYWLQRILAAHADVAAVPSETYLFSRGLVPLGDRFQHEVRNSLQVGSVYMQRAAYIEALRTFCDAVFTPFLAGHRYLVERTPEHALALDLIGEVYPDAAIIHIVRDGRDVVRSLLSMEWGPDSVEEAAEEWRSCVEAAHAAGAGLERYREVRYEALLEEPEAQIRSLLEWLDLDTSPTRIDDALAEARALLNVDPRAPGAAAGKWRTELDPAQLAAFDGIAGATMTSLGYAEVTSLGYAEVTSLGYAPATTSPGQPASSRAPGSRIGQLVDRARGALDRSRNSNRESLRRLRVAEPVVRQFVEAVARNRPAELKALLSDGVSVRMVSTDGDWSRRGPTAVDALIRALSEDPALSGEQVWADVVPSVPTFTALLTFRSGRGAVDARVFALTVEDAVITGIVGYRLPVE